MDVSFKASKDGFILSSNTDGARDAMRVVQDFVQYHDYDFWYAAIRGTLHGGSGSSDSRQHLTVNFKDSNMQSKGTHRPAHIVVEKKTLKVDHAASELFKEVRD